MKNSYTYHKTTGDETLEPHLFIDHYSDPAVKACMHRYKFNKETSNEEHIEAKNILLYKTLDICLELYMCASKGMVIYTSPPSTMCARGEKDVDSMFELIKASSAKLLELVQKLPGVYTYTQSIFSISQKFLVQKRAQHIDGSRRKRIENLYTRYTIPFKHTLYIFYCIHIRKIQHFSYVIIDDVSSTGSTLLSCKDITLRNMSLIHRKNPHITYDVRIFSLTH